MKKYLLLFLFLFAVWCGKNWDNTSDPKNDSNILSWDKSSYIEDIPQEIAETWIVGTWNIDDKARSLSGTTSKDSASEQVSNDGVNKINNLEQFDKELSDQLEDTTWWNSDTMTWTWQKIIGKNFTKDSKNIYYRWNVLSWADVSTFKLLLSTDSYVYAKDKNQIYIWGNGSVFGVQWSDPSSFRVVDGYYVKDKNHVYAPNKVGIYKIEWADPATFQTITDYNLSKDKNHVYVYNIVIKWADPATFQVLRTDGNVIYAKDKNQLYFGKDSACYPFPQWDYNTFQVIDKAYAKDKKNIYRQGDVVKWADPATFQIINDDYAKDKNHVYKGDQTQTWVDPNTFTPGG